MTAGLRRPMLDGPPLSAGAESLAGHRERLGPLPDPGQRPELIPLLESSGLLGRGGAGFPVGRKWRSVAERAAGHAVVLVNGAEGEPLSLKDRSLMAARPHLIIDGALLAADAVLARDIIFYVGAAHRDAAVAIERAVAERSGEFRQRVRMVGAPTGYVSGEESAAVHFVETGVARPTTTPPRPFERGVGGRPTLVQNVESLAVAALIARHGAEWYRGLGHAPSSGTALFSVSGAVMRAGLHEVALGSPVGALAQAAGGLSSDVEAVLVGGYFGVFTDLGQVRDLPLDQRSFQARGLTPGCGVISFLPAHECGVRTTAGIITYLASQSARQCGPCVYGLSAIAKALGRLASESPFTGDLDRITRWGAQLPGRGACRHPDGAAALLQSALRVFADEFDAHQRGRCRRGLVVAGAA